MRIKKYTPEFTRRRFLDVTARGFLGAGVLAPVWSVLAENGDFADAYPDELLSIEEFTKGALKTGDEINKDNVHLVKDLLDPIRYTQVEQLGRRMTLVKTTTDISRLSPVTYIEATLRHQGMAKFDDKGNVVVDDGQPWVGGNPFPNPQNGVEMFAGITLTWGRHDVSFYPVKTYELDPQGKVAYRYELAWCEFAPTGRITLDPKPVWPGHEDKLRYQSVFFTEPQDFKVKTKNERI